MDVTLHDSPPRKENSLHRHFHVALVAHRLAYSLDRLKIADNDRYSLRLLREFATSGLNFGGKVEGVLVLVPGDYLTKRTLDH